MVREEATGGSIHQLMRLRLAPGGLQARVSRWSRSGGQMAIGALVVGQRWGRR